MIYIVYRSNKYIFISGHIHKMVAKKGVSIISLMFVLIGALYDVIALYIL